MAAGISTVFSEYEVRQMNMIIGDKFWEVKCIGKLEESSEVRKTVKKCRGVIAKQRTRGTGAGTLKLTAHIPWELYYAMLDMDREDLADGVYGYGTPSLHPVIKATADVFDEDDNEKFKAWPNCTATSGPARSVENGSEEVAEVDIEIGFSPDEFGYGIYEAMESALADEIKTAWMESFAPELVQVSTV